MRAHDIGSSILGNYCVKILKDRLQKCVDWSKIDKDEYLSAMRASPTNTKPIWKP